VGGGGWVDGQALGVADVSQVAEELQAFYELLTGSCPAFDAEAKDCAGAFRQVFLSGGVIGAVFQTGLSHPIHLGVIVKELGHFLGVLNVAFDAQAEGFKSLE